MHPPTSLLNPRSTHASQRTIVVFGLYRGGTTMVARVLRELGVFMGERMDPRGNEEDLDFQHADAARVTEVARARDAAHDLWGWKYPGAFHTIHDWYRGLRDPYFVVVFRDVLAAAQTELTSGNFDDLIQTTAMKLEHTARILEFVSRASNEGLPTLLVSYERAALDGGGVVDALCEFAGLAPTDEVRAAAAAAVDRRRGYGTADGLPPR